MSEHTTGRKLTCQIVIWTIAAIMGITIAMLAVGLLGLWVLVGVGGAVGGALVTGWVLTLLFCTDFDAMLAQRAAAQQDRDISS
jgi:hypothetical protein